MKHVADRTTPPTNETAGPRPGDAGRRRCLVAAAALLGSATGVFAQSASRPAARPLIEVWKSPTCGCCGEWIKHMEANGFQVKVNLVPSTAPVRSRVGMDSRFGSCHTALVDGYVVEGHVPARDIQRLLKDRPQAVGLAVPGMPIGSPGMGGPAYNGRRDPYDVLLVTEAGAAVWARYR